MSDHVKPSIAVMIGASPGKGMHGHGEPDSDEPTTEDGASDGGDASLEEEMGGAVQDAINSNDPRALYRAICDIVKYEKA